jgi:calcineurin-like phosphoesterase family protein
MDETMVDNWNRVVRPKDTVYHLGDVVIARRNLETVKRLNGRKILIRGNHDIFRDKDYYEAGFEQIHGVRVFVDKFILSHIPLHPDCVGERFKRNVHGHLHGNRIMQTKLVGCNPDVYMDFIDPRYLSVCVEQINFTPVSFDAVENMT